MAQKKQIKGSVKKLKGIVDENYFAKVEYTIFRVVLTFMVLSTMTRFLIREVSFLNPLDGIQFRFNIEELKPLIVFVVAILAAGIVLFVTMTLFVKFLTNKRTESARIWSSIITAFVGALDESSFKPHQGSSKPHERLN